MVLKKTLLFILVLLGSSSCATYQHHIPTKAFVKVIKTINILECQKESTTCKPGTYTSTGSGSIIKTNKDNSYILTAGHVCETHITPIAFQEIQSFKIEVYVLDYTNKITSSEVLAVSDLKKSQTDLCLLKTKALDHRGIAIARYNPRIGQKLYSMGSPAGIYHPPTVPIFMGLFSGPMPDGKNFLSTVPAVGGSSGSAILNEDMRIVGVLFATHPAFNNVTISTNLEQIKIFLNKHLFVSRKIERKAYTSRR